MITNIKDLDTACHKKYVELSSINEKYLNDAGKAAIEAYKAVLWQIAFHDSLLSLYEDGNYQDLKAIPNKHPEYYLVLETINRAIIRSMNN